MVPLSPAVEHVVDAIYSPQRQAIAGQLSALEIRIFFGAALLQLVLLFGYYYTGAAAWVRAVLERRLRRPVAISIAFVGVSFAGYAIALLPIDWFAGFTVPHVYGLSRETPATWFHDWALSNVVTLAVLLVLWLAFATAVRKLRGRWPLAAALAAAPCIVFGNAIFPVYVAPLFNRYTPLPATPLTSSILALAAREGVDASAVYEYDMSRQTTEGNAYVAGLGPTARIAVGDTLLAALRPDELLYIVAHEIGHYKLHHIWWGSLYGWIGAIVAVVFVALASRGASRASAPRLDDPAVLPLVAALLLCFALASAPIANGVSRGIEHAADVFAATHTQLGDAGIRAFAKLGSQDLSVVHPNAIVVWYFYTHPPLDERIAYAAEHANAPGHIGLTDFPK